MFIQVEIKGKINVFALYLPQGRPTSLGAYGDSLANGRPLCGADADGDRLLPAVGRHSVGVRAQLCGVGRALQRRDAHDTLWGVLVPGTDFR